MLYATEPRVLGQVAPVGQVVNLQRVENPLKRRLSIGAQDFILPRYCPV